MATVDWKSRLDQLQWKPAISEAEFRALPRSERLKRVRHSAAHVMATALRRLHPDTQFAIGPPTPHGFFYDVRAATPLSTEEFADLEAEMGKVAASRAPFEVASISHNEAVALFGDLGQPLKLDVLERIKDPTVTLYRNADFLDLCAGPHVPHCGYCKSVKLLTLSSAHWRQEDKPSLTRISGTAWEDNKTLQAYMRFLEESRARDHRTLGPQLDLFSFHPWAASALFHPKGVAVRNELLALWREVISRSEYIEILNPLLYRKELYETSGHWDHFQQDMFIFREQDGSPAFVLKPMNCPDTMLFFRSQGRSYRDLPLRVAEGQILHRNETTGALHGIMRTRSFVQDDAHIFLSGEQVEAEIGNLLAMIDEVYGLFGLDYEVRVSTRPDPFMGEAALWDQAENALKAALTAKGKQFIVDAGQGAFYGPKIDVKIKDSLGRSWQCGTIQLDFQMPQRFELKYAAADGTNKQPIVIHRAIFGSVERFLGVILEHFAGALPTWLAPVQVAVLPLGEGHLTYAEKIVAELRGDKLRVELHHEQSVNYRIRAAEKQKIPFMLVVGDREVADGTVSVRRHKTKANTVMPLSELRAQLLDKVRRREQDSAVEQIELPFVDQDEAAPAEAEAAVVEKEY